MTLDEAMAENAKLEQEIRMLTMENVRLRSELADARRAVVSGDGAGRHGQGPSATSMSKRSSVAAPASPRVMG